MDETETEEQVMKRNLRKFLSLLMVFALLCGMVPAAFAAVSAQDIYWFDGARCDDPDNRSPYHVPLGGDNGFYIRQYCGTLGVYDITDHEHDWQYLEIDEDYHYKWCTISDCEYYGARNAIEEAHDEDCPCQSAYADHDHRYTYIDSEYHEVECYTTSSCKYWEAQYEEHTGNPCICEGLGSTGEHGLYVDQGEVNVIYTELDEDVVLSVSAYMYDENDDNVTSDYEFDFSWTGIKTGSASYGSSRSTAKLDTSAETAEASCTITAYDSSNNEVDSVTVTWYGELGGSIFVSATVYNTNPGYALGEEDDEGYTSIEEQIYDAVSALAPRNGSYELEYVEFDDVDEPGGELSAYTNRDYYYYAYSSSTYALSEVVFDPTDNYEGKVTFPFAAYYEDDNNSNNALDYVTGTISFDVKKGGSGLGIVYTALAGEDVELDEDKFAQFWEDIYPNGTLDYVRFGSISTSKGKLYDAYNTTQSAQIKTTTKCYYDPASTQTGLNDLTFVPKDSKVTYVEIPFSAYGSTKASGKTGSTPVDGVVTILYTAKDVTPIEYESTGTAITLDADDFIAKYKEVMDVKTSVIASRLTFQLLDIPTNGTLYMDFVASLYGQNRGVTLTEKNVLNYTFNASASGRSIEDVTYVPGSYSAASDSVPFACYYNNQLKFVGTVNFGAIDPITVEYVTAGTTPVTFSSYDFNHVTLQSGYLYFGTPSKGTLYRNYASGFGTRVNNYDTFTASSVSYGSVYSLNTLTYVPAPGYVGVVEIPVYSASALLATQTKATIKIYVGRSFTDVIGTPSVWAAPYINKLSAQGIVNGTDVGMTKFSPTKTVTYGEALKLIMMAAGYPNQAKTGTHWASGFLTKAYYDGLVSSSNIDLDATVNRDTIATITAKALGLSSASSVNWGITAPCDSANGYVYALYNAGILAGVNQNGQNYFLGSNNITRAEISKIICMVADYEA